MIPIFEDVTTQLQFLLYVVMSLLLSGIVGYEREREDKPAGIRTHMFVGLSSTSLILLAEMLLIRFDAAQDLVRADPIRTLEAIITGISFLGAGTILHRREKGTVEGLTTAASILFASVIGIAVATDLWVFAIGATFISLLTLRFVKRYFH